jgi:hypothetical protein
MNTYRSILRFFDKLEDAIRFRLSKRPIIYALIGSIGIVLVWKGVWEVAQTFPILYGVPSFVLGVLILLSTGLLVSFFIGDSIIMSGFKREKKLAEKTEAEVKTEMDILVEIRTRLEELEKLFAAKGKVGDSDAKNPL